MLCKILSFTIIDNWIKLNIMSLLHSSTTADYLEWDTMLSIVRRLYKDGNYRISLLIGIGAFTGLRISDILTLRWKMVLGDSFTIVEKKTGKVREVKVNKGFCGHIQDCYNMLGVDDIEEPCFVSRKNCVYSVQRVNVILKEVKERYNVKIVHFSTHSLRKTFGRRVVEMAGEKSEMALIKLAELFNHSTPQITRRYLGLRREELMEVYDGLYF